MSLPDFLRQRILAVIAGSLILLSIAAGLSHPDYATGWAAMAGLATLALFIIAWQQKSETYKFVTAQPPVSIEAEALEARLGYRADLLELMTSSEPRSIILADKWERILFANKEAARRAGRSSDELIGSTFTTMVGAEQARIMRSRLTAAFRTGAPLIHVDDNPTSFNPRITQTSYIPVADTAHIKDAILITESDITSVITERDRREKMLRQVLDVCVAIVDRRDPHAAGHSALVGEIASRLATIMNLPDLDAETAEIAGVLMNFGKVLVPQTILTKATTLTAEELALVRGSMLAAADVLSIIQFELPVVETLRQLHEHYDGSGLPEGRRGTDIIVTARICVVVNTFVAMVSNRAHRQGMSSNDALDILRQKAGTQYDPQVLEALTQFASKPEWTNRLTSLQNSPIFSLTDITAVNATTLR